MDKSTVRIHHIDGHPHESDGVVVIAHGGKPGGPAHPAWADPAYLIVAPFSRAVRTASRGRIATVQVFHPQGGWEVMGPAAEADMRRVLAEVRRRFPSHPMCLVGHSSGGCAALRAGDEPQVRSITALAPYLPPTEPVDHLRERSVLVLHGARDRIASFEHSESFVLRLQSAGGPARLMPMRGGHMLLRQAAQWRRRVAAHAVSTLMA